MTGLSTPEISRSLNTVSYQIGGSPHYQMSNEGDNQRQALLLLSINTFFLL
jgi:hypothetical protein